MTRLDRALDMVRLLRSGWLAVGAAVAAFVVLQVGVQSVAVAIVAVGCLAVALAPPTMVQATSERPASNARRWAGRYPPRRAAAAAVGFGALLIAVRTCAGPATVEQAPVGERGDWTARVVSIGGTFDGRQRAVLVLDPPAAGRVYARLPRYPVVAPGDAITFTTRLEVPPDGEGFGAYLARLGVTATAEVRGLTISRPSDDPVETLRRRADQALAAILPEPEAGLAAGIVIGLRDRVDREVADDLTTAGLSHVVAISGWNIAVVAGLIAALLRGWPRRRRAILMIAAIAVYTVLAGASPSVVRAALMAGIVLLARESGRPGRAGAALGLAALLMLLVDPVTILDAGFHLSVAATAGLIAWATPLTDGLSARAPARTPSWILEALGVSLAAQAATLPIVLVAFGRLSLVAPIANLVAAPFVLPAMVVGALALPVGWLVDAGLPDALGTPVALAARATFGALIAIGRIAADVPLAAVALEPPAALASAATAAIALGLVLRRARPSQTASPLADRRAVRSSGGRAVNRLWLASLVVIIAGGALAISARPDGRLRVTVLDVGQGDAILVEGDAGSRMLVDGGPDPDRLLVVLDGRLPAWDRRLELVVLTHPHEDHVAGLALLLQRYRVRTVAEVGMRGPGPGYAAFLDALDRLGVHRQRLAAGDRLRLDRATIEVRWPPPGGVPLEPSDTGTAINNVSAVLDMRFGTRRLLLTGDVEAAIDPQLLASGIADGRRLDFLKVAHHGSRTSSTEAFLAALRPRVAVVSAGTGNPYGHPTRQALMRLAAAGARVFRTDTDGSVTIETDGHDLRVEASGPRQEAIVSGRRPAPATVGALSPISTVARLSAPGPAGTADPAARYRCATPRIGPWIAPLVIGPPATRRRDQARPPQAAPPPPADDDQPGDQPGLLLGRGRLWHRARRAPHGGRARRTRGGRRSCHSPSERRGTPRDLAGGRRGGGGWCRRRTGRAPP